MLSSRGELIRKGWHMASGLAATPLVLYTNLEYATIVGLAGAFFVFAIELLTLFFGIRLPFWTRQLERVRRPEENFSWASIGFVLTLVVLMWLAPLPVALAAAGMLAFGDGTSALAGRAFGRHKIPWNRRKSWEGSTAGLLAGFVGAWLLVQWYARSTHHAYPIGSLVVVVFVGSLFAMLAESLPRFQDNVTVPAFAGASMMLVWAGLGLDPALGALADRLHLGFAVV